MATKVWSGGAGTTAYATAGNWVGGAAPIAGDTIIFPAYATVNVEGSDQSATHLEYIIEEEGCTITFGSAGTPLILDVSNSTPSSGYRLGGTGQKWLKILNATGATVYITGSAGTSSGSYGTNLVTTGPAKMVVSLASGQTLGVSAQAGDTTSTVTAFAIEGGTVVIGSTTKVGGGVPNITATGGTVRDKCAIGTVAVTDTNYTHDTGAATSITADRNATVNYDSSTAATAIAMKANSTLNYGAGSTKPTAITYVGSEIVVNDPFGVTAA